MRGVKAKFANEAFFKPSGGGGDEIMISAPKHNPNDNFAAA